MGQNAEANRKIPRRFKKAEIAHLRAKFNDALNTAAEKMGHYIMTINSCSSYNHFDRAGHLSSRGKEEFWLELDNLLERFEKDKVKLKPNPHHKPRLQPQTAPSTIPYDDRYFTSNRRQHVQHEDYRRKDRFY